MALIISTYTHDVLFYGYGASDVSAFGDPLLVQALQVAQKAEELQAEYS